MADDVLKTAAERLEKAAAQLTDLPALLAAAQSQSRARQAADQMETARGEAALALRAQLEAAQALTQARQEAARARAAAAYSQSPGGQAQLTLQAQAGQARSTADLTAEAARAGALAAYAATPGGQAQARMQTQERQDRSTFDLRAQAARMNAEAAHFRTPLGQAQLRSQDQAQAENDKAKASLAQARGQGPGVADRFASVLGAAAGAVGIFTGAIGTATGVLMGVGGKASPTHAATLGTSMELLEAKLGQYLVPALEATARAAQALANRVPDPESRAGRGISGALAGVFGQGARAFVNDMLKDEKLKVDTSQLPGGQLGGVEQYADRLATVGVRQDELQAELLKVQLEALRTLKDINREGPGSDRLDPAFR